MMLRDLTNRLGALHEAQVLQLKMWPLVLFQHVKKCEERVNIEAREIDFVLLQTKGEVPKDFKKRCMTLAEWTKWLLGGDWVVRVKLRDKLVFRVGATLSE